MILELWATRFVACLALVASVALGVSLFDHASPNRPAGGDFIGFYVPARLAITDPGHLYDSARVSNMQRELTGAAVSLPFAHAPLLAFLLCPLALLSFHAAYFVWMGCSVILYGAAVLLVSPRGLRPWSIPFAFACPLFPLYVMAAGQVTAIDCFAVALGFHLDRKSRFFISGVALSLCTHKPILPLCLLLMLIATRRFRSVGGLLASSATIAVASVAIIGRAATSDFIGLVLGFGRAASTGGIFNAPKYIDLVSFGRMLPLPALPSFLAVALLAATVAVAWVYCCCWSRHRNEIAWSATLASATLLSPYAPIYEGVFLVLAVAILARIEGASLIPPLAVVACPLAFATQASAALLGVQILTLVGVAVALYSALLCNTTVPGTAPGIFAPQLGRTCPLARSRES